MTELRGLTYANGVVSVSDAWQYFLSWGSDTLTSTSTEGGNHISRFNAYTGVPISNMESFDMTGPGSGTSDLVADAKGNIYVGGRMSHQAFLPSGTLTNIGGTFDFFVAGYGAEKCDCASPIPDFTFSATSGSNTVDFSYTGTGGAVDSVRWEFGDGAMANSWSASHTYTTTGTYEVSVVIYSPCGIKVVAGKIAVGDGTGIQIPGLSASVTVFPNPAAESVRIDGTEPGTEIRFYNNAGRQSMFYSTRLKNETIDISGLGSGVYIIRIATTDGKEGSIKVVKK